MTRVSWNDVGQRFYEAGTDRGVLYLAGQAGVPWNGLVGVNENSSGGEPKAYYLDGYKYLNVAASEEYAATINAFTSPREFDSCDGTAAIQNGLFATQQPRKNFGFSYRTLVGNDVDGLSLGYKIHIVYNALASPAQRSYKTNGDSASPLTLDWSITTLPPRLTGLRPTAHFVIDSRLTPPRLLEGIENILYGSATTDPRLPTADELATLFTSLPPIAAVNWLTNGSFELPGTAVSIRRNFIRYPTTSPNGWTLTGSGSSIVSENGKLKITAGASSTYRLGVIGTLAPVKPAGDYTASFVGRAADPSITHVRVMLYDSIAAVVRGGVTLPIVAGGISDYKYEFTLNATGEFNNVYMEFICNSPAVITSGAVGYIGEPLFESGTLHRPYFHADQRPKERRNAAKQPQARSVTGWYSNDSNFYSRSWDAQGGRRPNSGAVIYTRAVPGATKLIASVYAVGMSSWNTPDWIPVTPGEIWTVSGYAKSDQPFNSRMTVSYRTAAGVAAGAVMGNSTNDIAANEWVQASQTITIPDGVYYLGVGQYVYVSGADVSGGEKCWMTDALIEKGSSVNSFFDPTIDARPGFGMSWEGVAELSSSYMYDTDFSVVWTGAVGASEVDLQGIGVGTYNSPSSVIRAIQSTRFVEAGGKSIRQIPVWSSRASGYTEVANHVAPRGLVPGSTYTFIATFYQEAPQGFGNVSGSYRALALTAATLTEYNTFAQADDISGRQVLRMVFTVPPTGSWYLRLINGGMIGDPSVWWDNAAIIDGVYQGDAFDGDTPDTDIRIYDWAGGQFLSPSTLRSWYY